MIKVGSLTEGLWYEVDEGVVGDKKFPDGTPLIKTPEVKGDKVIVTWMFDGMEEIFTVYNVGRKYKDLGYKVELKMPYVPNARQDRVKKSEDVFTLKYMAEIINLVGFDKVEVLDVHSDVSLALLNKVENVTPEEFIKKVKNEIGLKDTDIVFFPDNGSQKRYGDMVKHKQAYGVKNRDWATGEIKGLDVIGDIPSEPFDVLIVDDISSYGGTFYFSAKKLKELGARKIYLYVTHCENSILQGKLIEGEESYLIEKVFTTNSIYRGNHPKIEVIDIGIKNRAF